MRNGSNYNPKCQGHGDRKLKNNLVRPNPVTAVCSPFVLYCQTIHLPSSTQGDSLIPKHHPFYTSGCPQDDTAATDYPCACALKRSLRAGHGVPSVASTHQGPWSSSRIGSSRSFYCSEARLIRDHAPEKVVNKVSQNIRAL